MEKTFRNLKHTCINNTKQPVRRKYRSTEKAQLTSLMEKGQLTSLTEMGRLEMNDPNGLTSTGWILVGARGGKQYFTERKLPVQMTRSTKEHAKQQAVRPGGQGRGESSTVHKSGNLQQGCKL